MMQKLSDCRVDAIRNSIEYMRPRSILPPTAPSSAKKAKKDDGEDEDDEGGGHGRMTRAKFRNMLDDVAEDMDAGQEETSRGTGGGCKRSSSSSKGRNTRNRNRRRRRRLTTPPCPRKPRLGKGET